MRWLKQQHTMLVGIDVTHPGIGSVKGTPSIAAVVASCDTSFAQYPCSLDIQESKKEVCHLFVFGNDWLDGALTRWSPTWNV